MDEGLAPSRGGSTAPTGRPSSGEIALPAACQRVRRSLSVCAGVCPGVFVSACNCQGLPSAWARAVGLVPARKKGGCVRPSVFVSVSCRRGLSTASPESDLGGHRCWVTPMSRDEEAGGVREGLTAGAWALNFAVWNFEDGLCPRWWWGHGCR